MKRFKSVLLCTLLFLSPLTHAYEPSLREKIGQMLLIGFEGKSVNINSPIAKSIEKSNIGGVILFDYNSRTKQYDYNIASPEQVTLLNQQLQSFATTSNLAHRREMLPLLISVDYEGGKVNRLKEEYGFPRTLSAKTMGTMLLHEVKPYAKTMADTLSDSGFNLDFAPVLDVDVNPENPVIGKKERSFSEDPDNIAPYAQLFSKAFTKKGVQCAYKHFPGHGSSSADSHLGFVDVTETWHDEELRPYEQSLKAATHCGMVMTAHIVNRKLDTSGLPATLSKPMLTGILRHELKFDGVIVTDDLQMKAITDHYGLEKAVTLAINAGADMLMFGNQLDKDLQDPEEIINLVQQQIAKGVITKHQIDKAYRHIRHFKLTLQKHLTVFGSQSEPQTLVRDLTLEAHRN